MHIHCASTIRYKQLKLHEQANTEKISLGKKVRNLSSSSGVPKHTHTNSFLHEVQAKVSIMMVLRTCDLLNMQSMYNL